MEKDPFNFDYNKNEPEDSSVEELQWAFQWADKVYDDAVRKQSPKEVLDELWARRTVLAERLNHLEWEEKIRRGWKPTKFDLVFRGWSDE